MSSPTFDYAALTARVVTPLLEKYGVDAVIVRTTKGSYNVANGNFPSASEADNTVVVAIMDFRADEIDGTLIRREDKRIYMTGTGFAPVQNDRLKIGSDEWEIISITPIKPGDVVVVYDIQARR